MDKPIAKPSIREENERAILAAAEAVFAEHGFGGATMAAIAARAGVPKPNVHYYFPTKERLYRAVIERVLTAWLERRLVLRHQRRSGRGADLLHRRENGSCAHHAARLADLGERNHARRAGHPGFSRHHADAMGALARARGEEMDRRRQAQADRAQGPLLHDLGDDPAIRQRRARDRDAGKRPARTTRRSSGRSGRWSRRFWPGWWRGRGGARAWRCAGAPAEKAPRAGCGQRSRRRSGARDSAGSRADEGLAVGEFASGRTYPLVVTRIPFDAPSSCIVAKRSRSALGSNAISLAGFGPEAERRLPDERGAEVDILRR